jgi:predicted MFS family arabinose efflux permease
MKIRPGDYGFTLILLFGTNLLGELDYQIIPPLLPLLAATFQVEPAHAGRIVPVYAASAGLFSLVFGHLSDRHGRKPYIKYGLLWFCLSALLTSLAPTLKLLYLARFLTGMATGALTTCATSYAADFFQYQQRGRAMGILSAAYFAAAIIGIPTIAVTAGRVGWRPIFLVIAGISLSLSPLMWQFLEPSPSCLPSKSLSSGRLRLGQIAKTLAAALKRTTTCVLLLASMLSSGAVVGFITYLGSHLNIQLHVPIHEVGLVFLWAGLASLMGAPLAGVLSDRLGKKVLLVVSGVILAFCLLIIPTLSQGMWLLACLGLAGLSMAFRMAPLLSIITELVPPEERGTVLALRGTLAQVGIAVSTLLASYCYLYGGYRVVGLFTAAQVAVSTLLIWCYIHEPYPKKTAQLGSSGIE